MKLRGGEFSTGTTGIFQPELTGWTGEPRWSYSNRYDASMSTVVGRSEESVNSG